MNAEDVTIAAAITANASTPITELELETEFAPIATRDADMFWQLVDGDMVDAEWSNAGVRGRFFSSLRAAGCGKRMIDGIAHFTFVDGSAVTVSRFGIEC